MSTSYAFPRQSSKNLIESSGILKADDSNNLDEPAPLNKVSDHHSTSTHFEPNARLLFVAGFETEGLYNERSHCIRHVEQMKGDEPGKTLIANDNPLGTVQNVTTPKSGDVDAYIRQGSLKGITTNVPERGHVKKGLEFLRTDIHLECRPHSLKQGVAVISTDELLSKERGKAKNIKAKMKRFLSVTTHSRKDAVRLRRQVTNPLDHILDNADSWRKKIASTSEGYKKCTPHCDRACVHRLGKRAPCHTGSQVNTNKNDIPHNIIDAQEPKAQVNMLSTALNARGEILKILAIPAPAEPVKECLGQAVPKGVSENSLIRDQPSSDAVFGVIIHSHEDKELPNLEVDDLDCASTCPQEHAQREKFSKGGLPLCTRGGRSVTPAPTIETGPYLHKIALFDSPCPVQATDPILRRLKRASTSIMITPSNKRTRYFCNNLIDWLDIRPEGRIQLNNSAMEFKDPAANKNSSSRSTEHNDGSAIEPLYHSDPASELLCTGPEPKSLSPRDQLSNPATPSIQSHNENDLVQKIPPREHIDIPNIPMAAKTDTVTNPLPSAAIHLGPLQESLTIVPRHRNSTARSSKALSQPFKSPARVKVMNLVEVECSRKGSHDIFRDQGSKPSVLRHIDTGLHQVPRSPFKSPVAKSTHYPSLSPRQLPSAAILDIQALERKLQTLRRAIKILAEDKDNSLETLVQRWREVGRDAAWELWRVVKEQESSGWLQEPHLPHGKRTASGTGCKWGWFDETTSSSPTREHSDVASLPLDDEEGIRDDPCQYSNDEEDDRSVGTMLKGLGIGPDTLGWDEKEGEFVEA